MLMVCTRSAWAMLPAHKHAASKLETNSVLKGISPYKLIPPGFLWGISTNFAKHAAHGRRDQFWVTGFIRASAGLSRLRRGGMKRCLPGFLSLFQKFRRFFL